MHVEFKTLSRSVALRQHPSPDPIRYHERILHVALSPRQFSRDGILEVRSVAHALSPVESKVGWGRSSRRPPNGSVSNSAFVGDRYSCLADLLAHYGEKAGRQQKRCAPAQGHGVQASPPAALLRLDYTRPPDRRVDAYPALMSASAAVRHLRQRFVGRTAELSQRRPRQDIHGGQKRCQ